MASLRFESAIKKLYMAFNDNSLNPEDCSQCTVGNILNGNSSWKHMTDIHGSERLNYVGIVNQNFGKRFNGYTPIELLKIEASFLKGCGYQIGQGFCYKSSDYKNEDVLFNGLSKVIAMLCHLEGIKNIMNYTKLFESKLESSNYTITEF